MGVNDEHTRTVKSDPFLAGRTEAAERYGYLSRNAAQWRRISMILILSCAACVLSVIYMSGSVTVVPYIVQVDEHGYEIAVEPVKSSRVDDRLVVAHIGRYIWSLRTVFDDPAAQLYLMNFVYSTTPTGTAAEKRYREFYNANSPAKIAETQTVNVTVNSVLPMSEETWQAEWTEDRYTTYGDKINTKHYRGIFMTAVVAPTAMRDVLTNPLGIFVTNFNYSEVL